MSQVNIQQNNENIEIVSSRGEVEVQSAQERVAVEQYEERVEIQFLQPRVVIDYLETTVLPPRSGVTGYLKSTNGVLSWVDITIPSSAWGSITGTLADQTDLQSVLDTKLESGDIADFVTDLELQNELANYAPVNANLSSFTNDTNFLSSGDPVSALSNDAGYLTEVTAEIVVATDAGGYYTSGDVEGILQEIGADLTTFTYNTEKTILALTGKAKDMAIASDTGYLFVHNGTNWTQTGVKVKDKTGIDVGFYKDSSPLGYNEDSLSDKEINHSTIGANDREVYGAIRSLGTSLQWHDGTVYNDIVLGFRFRENESGSYRLEHKPIGFETWLAVGSGNSNEVDPDGYPYVQQGRAAVGFYAGPMIAVMGGPQL